jgi:hypothetical protein
MKKLNLFPWLYLPKDGNVRGLYFHPFTKIMGSCMNVKGDGLVMVSTFEILLIKELVNQVISHTLNEFH